MQKFENMFPNISSFVIWPVISPIESIAFLRSIESKSPDKPSLIPFSISINADSAFDNELKCLKLVTIVSSFLETLLSSKSLFLITSKYFFWIADISKISFTLSSHFSKIDFISVDDSFFKSILFLTNIIERSSRLNSLRSFIISDSVLSLI